MGTAQVRKREPADERITAKVKLSSRDAQLFMDALANPPEPNEKLMEAVHAHNQLIESRD